MKKFLIALLVSFICQTAIAVQPECGANNTCGRWLESQGTFACDGSWCSCNYKQYTCGCEYDFDCSGISGTGAMYGCFNNKCEPCKSCSNCQTTDWSSYTTGYQFRIYKWCSCSGECGAQNNYRCAPGYYGSSSNGTSGCTRCPQLGSRYGSSPAGSLNITACYIPENINVNEDSGTYVFVSDCNYSN